MPDVWTSRESLDLRADLVGFDVEAEDGHIGKIDEVSTETVRHYLVVDTGFWIFGKKRLIPAAAVSHADFEQQKLFVGLTKDQIRSAPDYEDARSAVEDAYYDEVGGYYNPYLRR